MYKYVYIYILYMYIYIYICIYIHTYMYIDTLSFVYNLKIYICPGKVKRVSLQVHSVPMLLAFQNIQKVFR